MFTDLFPPITYTVAFMASDLEASARLYSDWIRKMELTTRPQRLKKVKGSLESLLKIMFPQITPFNKVLFLKTRSPWTAVLFNDKNGRGAREHMGQLSRVGSIITLHATCVPHTFTWKTKKGYFGATTLRIADPSIASEGHPVARMISTSFQDRWEFSEHGDRLPFENVDAYGRSKPKDRFTPELLGLYLKNYGIDLFGIDFYAPMPENEAILMD